MVGPRQGAHVLRGRRNLAGARQTSYGAIELSAARDARLPVATREAIAFCEKIRSAKKISLVDGIEEISKPRREVLPYGALVLEQLLRRLSRPRSTSPSSASARGCCSQLLPRASAERIRYSRSVPSMRACDPVPSTRLRAVRLDGPAIRTARARVKHPQSGDCVTPPA